MGVVYCHRLMHWDFSITKSSEFFRKYHSQIRRCSSCCHLRWLRRLSRAMSEIVLRTTGTSSSGELSKGESTSEVESGKHDDEDGLLLKEWPKLPVLIPGGRSGLGVVRGTSGKASICALRSARSAMPGVAEGVTVASCK